MPFFDLGGFELFFIAIVALIVVGPKDLPKLMRAVGRIMAKIRGTARHFKAGLDEMVRQSELEEMRQKWDAHNDAVMKGEPFPDMHGPDEPTSGTAPGEPTAPAPAPVKANRETGAPPSAKTSDAANDAPSGEPAPRDASR